MERPTHLLLVASSFLVFFSSFVSHQAREVLAQNGRISVDVGVILDLGSMEGKRCRTSISMAIDDFYAAHHNYRTRIILHTRDSDGDVVEAASAAVDLLKNVRVQAIIGPQTSSQTEFVADLGNKTQIPILSFSATSPSLSSARTPYFVRATFNDSSQVGAIAAIVEQFGWREVVPIYADSDYGAGIIPALTDALQDVEARVPYRSVISPSASDDRLDEELYKLMTMQTRVFVVHMTPRLGSRLFQRAQELGMMTDDYAWITTDGITDLLDLLDPTVIDWMQGVIGVRPYVPRSKEIVNFTTRFKARFRRDNPTVEPTDPTVFQLWAYDAAWALALAVEKVGASSPLFQQKPSQNGYNSDLAKLGESQTGPKILEAISNTQFHGLAGEFRLIDGQLQSSVFEIVNVNGKGGRGIGFWTPASGISRLRVSSKNKTGLKPVIWPGDSTTVPKGWQVPTNGKKLQIGVPVKQGFTEFVNVSQNPFTNETTVTGYCIDVFEAVMKALPYAVPYEYVPYTNVESYDDLVRQVFEKRFDAVVGDVTIIANRSSYVEFTLPYTESGVMMIVPVKEDSTKNIWIFLKPLTTDLWFGSLSFFFFTGFVVWVIEHRINKQFRGTQSQQLGLIFYFAFSTLVFAHREKLESNLSRFAVIVWVFVVLILTSSYTASLTSMLTVQQLQPTVTDVNELLKNGEHVGYQDGSFVLGMLKKMNFKDDKLRNYSTVDQYAQALRNGSAHGGVAAIFDEIPYLKLFLSEHCADYTMVGRTYKTDGFGFVFPRDSPLVPDVSRAVLNVTEGDIMTRIEKAWFGDQLACPSQSDSFSSASLNFQSFGGLFLITGVVSLLALSIFLAIFLCKYWKEATTSESSLWRKIVALAKYYDSKDLTSPTFKKKDGIVPNNGELNQSGNAQGAAIMPCFDGTQSPMSISNHSDVNFVSSDEGMFSIEPASPWIRSPPAEAYVELSEIREGRDV
ncbi:glutamate receptor 2.7 [Elaeis guineensis]|uniref:Glutamate receptor n=1 Tax=Elaeis guineensis var. tenera TaxID=51953 RepID=A0A6I9QS74_ELAGV|nr:glutamate receptor 2.7 [Elaeis guineensis]